MKLSVAMATFNGESFIAEQLASLAGQTRPPDELVVSDDGSTDETVAIVRSFSARAPFPVVIADKKDRLGFSDNFLRAAECCQHELVAFCDQDDVWLPRKLELGADRIKTDRSLLSLHSLTVTDEALRPSGFEWDQGIDRDCVHEPLQLDPYATGWGNTMVFRRELLGLIDRNRRPPQPSTENKPLSHDTWVYMLAAALGRVSWVKQPLILYRQHGSAATVSAKPPARRSLRRLAQAPVADFQDRRSINEKMVSILKEIAGSPGPYCNPAGIAADKFAERAAFWRVRAAIFEDPRLSARLSAYLNFHRDHAGYNHWWGAHLKDLAIGVAGISRFATKR